MSRSTRRTPALTNWWTPCRRNSSLVWSVPLFLPRLLIWHWKGAVSDGAFFFFSFFFWGGRNIRSIPVLVTSSFLSSFFLFFLFFYFFRHHFPLFFSHCRLTILCMLICHLSVCVVCHLREVCWCCHPLTTEKLCSHK